MLTGVDFSWSMCSTSQLETVLFEQPHRFFAFLASLPLSSSDFTEHSMPKAAPKFAAASSTPPASFSKGPMAERRKREADATVTDKMASIRRIQKFENKLQNPSLSFCAISKSRYAMDW